MLLHITLPTHTTLTKLTTMIETYTFAGDAVTYLGAIGVASTALILRTSFARHRKYEAIYKQQDDQWGYETSGK